MTTEIAFAKSFLALLDSKPNKISADHIEDPRSYPGVSPVRLPCSLSLSLSTPTTLCSSFISPSLPPNNNKKKKTKVMQQTFFQPLSPCLLPSLALPLALQTMTDCLPFSIPSPATPPSQPPNVPASQAHPLLPLTFRLPPPLLFLDPPA